MRVWEDPGQPGRAIWRCVEREVAWQTLGGSWYRRLGPPGRFVVVTVGPADPRGREEEPFHAWARALDLPGSDAISRAVSRGWGHVLGGVGGPSAVAARTRAKSLAEHHLSVFRGGDLALDLPPAFGPSDRRRTRHDRFHFELAREVLDAFARTSNAEFRRAWHLAEVLLHALTRLEQQATGATEDDARAGAWEDLQMAFTGHGEPFLSGVVEQLWASLTDQGERDRFASAIEIASRRAELGTGRGVHRRYLRSWRTRPPSRMERSPERRRVLPTRGSLVHAWAADAGHDPDWLCDKLALVEAEDRRASEEDRPRPGPRLRLVRNE